MSDTRDEFAGQGKTAELPAVWDARGADPTEVKISLGSRRPGRRRPISVTISPNINIDLAVWTDRSGALRLAAALLEIATLAEQAEAADAKDAETEAAPPADATEPTPA